MEDKKLRIYGQWSGNPRGRIEDTARCIESVCGQGEWISGQCSRKRGYGEKGLFCKQHAKMHEKYKSFEL